MSENKTIYLSDNPNIEQDSFQVHSNIAETLYGIIEKHDISKNSFTIGLFGEWGSGKSFIINKLSEKIKKDKEKDTTYLYIDIWKYSGFPLLRSILFDLDKQFCHLNGLNSEKYNAFSSGYRKNGHSLDYQLKYNKHLKEESKLTPKESWEKIYETLKKYKVVWILLLSFLLFFLAPLFLPSTLKDSDIYKSFSPLISVLKSFISFTGIGAVLLLLLKKPIQDVGNLVFFRSIVRDYTEQANFSPEQFEDTFKDMLGKIENEKYVIIFDNLDRCEPNVAYETLSTIKTFMDIENCFYIIPADDDAIKNYLSNSSITQNGNNLFERKFAEEFIDKIFQTYVRIPALKEVERDKYIKEQLTKIDFQGKLTDEDIETITQILYFAYKGESPRNIIRFVNDYSTYFQLALNSIPKLLDNIMLFTIMIAVKQKWYHFERILLENPDFFAKYPTNKELLKQIEHNNIKDLERFLDSIQSFYIPQIKHKSVDEYIHFKESEKSYEISDILKNNQPDEFELNDENVKILIREFKKIVKIKGQFSVNSFMTFAKLIKKNKDHRLYKNIVIDFWLGFIQTPKEQLKLIFGEMLDEDVLTGIMDSLNSENLYAHKKEIEEIIINYFKEPFENDAEFEEYEKAFDAVLSSNYKFTPSVLKKLFYQWKKESTYLNSLLKIISKNKKPEHLPSNVIKILVNNTIDDESIELMNYWTGKNIPNHFGSTLTSKLAERIKSRNIINYQNLNALKVVIEQDYKLLLLIYSSFITKNNKDEFLESLYNTSSRILQFANNQQPLFELGIKFWIETVYFANIDSDSIDEKLQSIFNSYIKPNATTISILEEELKYPNEILSLSNLKLSMFNASEKLQAKIYEKLENKHLSDFELVMPYPIETKHISEFKNYIEKKDVVIDENKFSEFLLKQIFRELINDSTNVTAKLEYLINTYDLKQHKKLILDNRNGIIDLYKENPDEYQSILLQVKLVLPYSDFFNSIIKPVLSFIKSELSKSEPVSKFINLYELIETTKNEKDINLLFSILSGCLENNQSLEENYLGIRLLSKIHTIILKEQQKEIKVLIISNDKYDQWDEETIEQLTKMGLVKDVESDEEESPAPNNV